MKASRFPVSLAGFLFSSVVVPATQPYIPGDDAVVLVRLPPSSSLHHRSPTPTVTSLPEALVEARELVREARRSGDPRLLGRAQSILRAWWTEINAPVDALLLRAEIKQGLHDFRSALEDLNTALRREPRHAGAWLLKTTLHQVLGDRAEAQRSCLQLARHADALTTTAAAASLRSQTDPD
ncbi:MAG: hypothetical protein L6Q38_15760, partial [Nitrospira sp.]|nr:hypothetical protein [Nitrospira sp.]